MNIPTIEKHLERVRYGSDSHTTRVIEHFVNMKKAHWRIVRHNVRILLKLNAFDTVAFNHLIDELRLKRQKGN